jgi:hypothetical protein
MISKGMAIASPNRDPTYGLVGDCMEYVVAKGNDVSTIR